MAEIGTLILNGKLEDLRKVKDDPSATVLKVLLAAIVIKALNTGDYSALESILNRMIGKVRENVALDHTSSDGSVAPAKTINVVSLSPTEFVSLKQIVKRQLHEPEA